MTADRSDPTSPAARSIALFPGGFKPPHVNHYETVRRLVERPDVEEVVVIISDRPRIVPGTTKALDVNAARQIWNLYLRDLDGVRVETAAGSAIAVATDRVRAGRRGDRFLLVFGDPDIAAGRERFGKAMRCRPDGVEASVERGAPNPRPARATEMRALLAQGDDAFSTFCRFLPDHLSVDEQQEVWTACRRAMVDRHSLTTGRIRRILESNGLGPVGRMVLAGRSKIDQVYRATLGDGAPVFIKYADDATNGSLADSTGASQRRQARKPRKRLKAEREALKWVRGNVESPVVVPDVICYDKAARTLVLSAVCTGGRRLGDELRVGALDTVGVRSAGRFLAAAHKAARPVEPFWDDLKADRHQWRTALAELTSPPAWADQLPAVSDRLTRLAAASVAIEGPGFCHLDFSPSNIVRGSGMVGVIDFERSTTFGDPAFDFGTQLGHYLVAGFRYGQPGACRAMIEASLEGYRSLADDLWATMASRVVGFCAAVALRLSSTQSDGRFSKPPPAMLEVCSHLLSLLDERDAELARASLVDCLADSRTTIEASSTTVRRRSLRSINHPDLWEGSVVEHARHGVITVTIHGGRPWSIVETHVDGVWVASSRLDSVGSAAAIISASPSEGRIEISDLDEPVLEGSLSPIRKEIC